MGKKMQYVLFGCVYYIYAYIMHIFNCAKWKTISIMSRDCFLISNLGFIIKEYFT